MNNPSKPETEYKIVWSGPWSVHEYHVAKMIDTNAGRIHSPFTREKVAEGSKAAMEAALRLLEGR